MRRLYLFIVFFIAFSVNFVLAQKTLVCGEVEKPMFYLPYFSDDPVTLRSLDLLFETLIKDFSNAVKTRDDAVIPSVLSNMIFMDSLSIDWSGNPQMRMRLRNSFWGDGSRISPDDVVFTVDKILKDRQLSTIFRYLALTIRNLRATGSELEVNFFFPSKYMVTSLEFFVLPSKIRNIQNYMRLANSRPSELQQYFSGPYLVSSEDETSVEFSVNRYASVRPKIQRIKLVKVDVAKNMVDRFIQGELDFIAPATYEPEFRKLETERNIKSIPSFDKRIFYLALNYNNKAFHDKNLRIAMAKVIDKNKIKEIFQGAGEVVSGPFHPNFPATDPRIRPYEYDPEAERLLRNYAKSLGRLKLIYQRDPLRRNERIVTVIGNNLKECGFNIEVVGLSTEQYYAALRDGSRNSFDMALVEYYTTSSFVSVRPLLDGDGPLNYGRFNSRANGSYDEYLTSLLRDVEGDDAFRIRDDIRMQKYREIHRLCHENQYHIWLFAPQTKVFYNADIVKVNYFVPERPFKNIADWDVNK